MPYCHLAGFGNLQIMCEKNMFLVIAVGDAPPEVPIVGPVPMFGFVFADTKEEAFSHIEPDVLPNLRNVIIVDLFSYLKDLAVQIQADSIVSNYVDKLDKEK